MDKTNEGVYVVGLTTSCKMVDGKTLADVDKSLESLPDDMLKFSICMRSLYVQHNVGSKSDVADRFQKLRDATRVHAMIYCTCILPFSKTVVSAVDDYYGFYQVLNFKEWKVSLPDILEKTKNYRDLCQMTIKMHEDMLIALEPREKEARQIMLQFTELQKEYEQKVEDLVDPIATKKGWAIVHAYIPFAKDIDSPILQDLSKEDQGKAIAHSEQAKIQETAALIVEKELIPALEAFIKGLRTVTGFFSVIENQFVDEEEGTLNELQGRFKYRMMRRRAEDIQSYSKRFMFVIPCKVTTNFASIPTEGSDRNYIDKWLKKQEVLIEKQRNAKVNEIFSQLRKNLAQAI